MVGKWWRVYKIRYKDAVRWLESGGEYTKFIIKMR